MSELIGKQLGSYRLIKELGKGGFAVVYLGEHVHLNTSAAIKVLHHVQLSGDDEKKFRTEAKTIANLRHQHIIRVLEYDIQESTGIPYLIMEYAPGNLRQLYPAGTKVQPLKILPYVQQVADALQYAHDHKVIHRDVKPENMLLDGDNKVLLSDFGIAVVYETSLTAHTLDKLGTPPYMAPEQFKGKPLHASDQYSLGIVVYEWLCGTRPFKGSPVKLNRLHESAKPPPMSEIVPTLSPAIENVVQKALAKDPRERYSSVRDFAQAFQGACQADNDTRRTFRMPPSKPAIVEQARPIMVTPPEDSSVIWNIPYHRNPFFTGRSDVLTLLHDTFRSGKATTRTQAVSGLGGIGKTQVALEYVYRYHSEYRVILWVRGETQEKMLSDIASLATLLKLKGQHMQEQHQVIEEVRTWLKKNTKWLLIIDNIEDLRLVQKFIPSTSRGHILLTTRTQTTGDIAQRIDLGKMMQEEGALFLLRRTKMLTQDATLQDASTSDCQMAKAVAEVLDNLPLALDQAGAYIEETGCTLSNYLHRYQARRMKLLDKRGGFDFGHSASVTATFSSTFKKVEKISPAAMELLCFLAFLDPDTILEELIINGATELGPVLQPVAADPIALDATIVTLRRSSLVHRNSGTNLLSVDRLVQAVLRDSMDEETQRMWVERTVRAINRALPDVSDYLMWQRCQQSMPHVQNCVALIKEWKIVSTEAARLLEQAGIYLQIQAQFTQAYALFERASDLRSLLNEAEPVATVAFLNHCFWHNYYLGQYAQAEPLIWKALRLLQQMPCTDQQSLAPCQEAIAYLCYQQGKYSQAEDYFLQALATYEKHVGLQHSAVVCTFCGLGKLYLALAKYDRAEEFFWDALGIWEQMPEPRHPLRCTSLNGLAQLALERGKYAEAEVYLQKERVYLERTLQRPHPTLASNLNNWALLSLAQGKYHEAEPLLRQSLSMLEQTVGLQHPIAGCTFDTLGRLSFLQGKSKAAGQFLQKAQSVREQALGVEHPEVLTTINNLADVYMKQGKLNVAEELYKDVLAARTRILGAEHPAVAQTLHSMAQLSYNLAQYALAEDTYRNALTIREKALGPEHPSVAQSLFGLALLYYWKWKKFDLAETFFQQALAIYEKVRVPEHPEVARILITYASFLMVRGRNFEAAEAMSRAKAILAKHALASDTFDQ